MKLKRFKTITVMIVVFCILTLSLSGCAPAASLWEDIRQIFDGNQPVVTETSGSTEPGSETSSNDGETGGESVTDPVPTTIEPEGEEMVKVARKLDPLLWEVGEKLYYIDLNTNTLQCRYDMPADDDPAAAPITQMLTDQVSAIIGFSTERIFCLSYSGDAENGRPVHDVIAVNFEGTERKSVALQVNSGAVLDDNWLVVSRYSQPLQISVIDLENGEEHVIFEDDGNIYPGMSSTDEAMGCRFEPMGDGIRIDVEYPGYSEFAYVRYLLLRDGAIAKDSKLAPWQDDMGQMMFEQGMFTRLMRVKNYDDLVIYEQSETDGNTMLVYDHPDMSSTLIDGSDYYLSDFFYHQGKVIAPVFNMKTGDSQEARQVLIYDPAADNTSMVPDEYDNYFQFEDKLAAVKIERNGETGNNISGRFTVELLNANARPETNILDQILVTGSVYGDISYKAWRAGHDLVIYYETYEPDEGEITSTGYNWIFLNLRG